MSSPLSSLSWLTLGIYFRACFVYVSYQRSYLKQNCIRVAQPSQINTETMINWESFSNYFAFVVILHQLQVETNKKCRWTPDKQTYEGAETRKKFRVRRWQRRLSKLLCWCWRRLNRRWCALSKENRSTFISESADHWHRQVSLVEMTCLSVSFGFDFGNNASSLKLETTFTTAHCSPDYVSALASSSITSRRSRLQFSDWIEFMLTIIEWTRFSRWIHVLLKWWGDKSNKLLVSFS